jgi:formylglycine-generating enzyme required for sulfatase activity
VSWYDCVEFCNELSKKDKRTPCYALANVKRGTDGQITSAEVTFLQEGTGYRLPTEAEWEYAARAGTKTAFWWGESITTDQANYDGTSTYGPAGRTGAFRKQTTPVEFFAANPWGLRDMGGNLYQWCQDWYELYEGGDVKDPVRLQKGDIDARVLRGGSWNSYARWCRAASRFRFAPADRRDDLYGFRIVSRLD